MGVELNRVKSHPFYAGGRLPEHLNRLFDFFNRHFPGRHAARKRDGRGRQSRHSLNITQTRHPERARGCGPPHRQLYADFRACIVNCFRQGEQPGRETVVVRPQHADDATDGKQGRGHVGGFHGDEPCAALGPSGVPRERGVVDFAPHPGQAGAHGGHHHPVLELKRPDLSGLQQLLEIASMLHCLFPITPKRSFHFMYLSTKSSTLLTFSVVKKQGSACPTF